ncbi:MAG: hypothetical protein J0L93_08375 [Deltaproteobacteria bacterium]|nr:hypothetical protein [Deltaproteobacteria bacterium]
MERKFLKIFTFGGLILIYSLTKTPLASEEKHAEEHGEEHAGEKHDEGEKDEHGHGEGHEESSPKFGPGKAILAVRDEGKTFQLSEESIKFLKIEFSAPQFVIETKGAKPLLQIPRSALVSFQENMGIYIQDGKWIQLIPVKVLKKINGHVFVHAEGLDSDALIATKGVPFIRTAHLEASGQGGEGHAH